MALRATYADYDVMFTHNDNNGNTVSPWRSKRKGMGTHVNEALVVGLLTSHPQNAVTERHAPLSPAQATFQKDEPEGSYYLFRLLCQTRYV